MMMKRNGKQKFIQPRDKQLKKTKKKKKKKKTA
jgi:hypothetical protein